MRSSVKTLCIALSVVVSFAAVHGNPCTNGEVCCRSCQSTCTESAFACFANCKSPCPDARDCAKVGNDVAQGVAAGACDEVISECEVSIFGINAASEVSPSPAVDLTTCCLIVRGSCQGNAENIACGVSGNYGSCTETAFKQKYGQKVSDRCKFTVCNAPPCRDELTSDDGC